MSDKVSIDSLDDLIRFRDHLRSFNDKLGDDFSRPAPTCKTASTPICPGQLPFLITSWPGWKPSLTCAASSCHRPPSISPEPRPRKSSSTTPLAKSVPRFQLQLAQSKRLKLKKAILAMLNARDNQTWLSCVMKVMPVGTIYRRCGTRCKANGTINSRSPWPNTSGTTSPMI